MLEYLKPLSRVFLIICFSHSLGIFELLLGVMGFIRWGKESVSFKYQWCSVSTWIGYKMVFSLITWYFWAKALFKYWFDMKTNQNFEDVNYGKNQINSREKWDEFIRYYYQFIAHIVFRPYLIVVLVVWCHVWISFR